MMKPEPSEVALRGCASGRPLLGTPRSKKSRKNSSKGEPGGNCGTSGPARSRPRSDFMVCVVEMLTTEGRSFSARSAKLSGAVRAATDPEARDAAATISKGASAPTTRWTKFDGWDDTGSNSSRQSRIIFSTDRSVPFRLALRLWEKPVVGNRNADRGPGVSGALPRRERHRCTLPPALPTAAPVAEREQPAPPPASCLPGTARRARPRSPGLGPVPSTNPSSARARPAGDYGEPARAAAGGASPPVAAPGFSKKRKKPLPGVSTNDVLRPLSASR